MLLKALHTIRHCLREHACFSNTYHTMTGKQCEHTSKAAHPGGTCCRLCSRTTCAVKRARIEQKTPTCAHATASVACIACSLHSKHLSCMLCCLATLMLRHHPCCCCCSAPQPPSQRTGPTKYQHSHAADKCWHAAGVHSDSPCSQERKTRTNGVSRGPTS